MNLLRKIIKRIFYFFYKICEIYHYCCCFISSLFFNFAYLPVKQALRMPIWVNSLHFGKDACYRGSIVIDTDIIFPKMIRLGVKYNAWYPYSGIMLQNFGQIVFKGKCIIGNDSSIYVKDNCKIVFGNDIQMAASQKIICENSVEIGDFTRFGWNCQIIDTDFHYMRNVIDETCNNRISAPVKIGRHNWFGNGCSIFKGFTTVDYITIGSGSKCRGRIEKEYSVWSNDGKLHLIGENKYRDLSKDRDMYNEVL